MKKVKFLVLLVVVFLILAGTASAHYGMIIPSDSMVMQSDNRIINLELSFSHPFEGIGMELAKPKVLGTLLCIFQKVCYRDRF